MKQITQIIHYFTHIHQWLLCLFAHWNHTTRKARINMYICTDYSCFNTFESEFIFILHHPIQLFVQSNIFYQQSWIFDHDCAYKQPAPLYEQYTMQSSSSSI